MSAGDWKNLFQAVENGDLELVRYHVGRGVDLNYQHPEILMTLLVTAIRLDFTEISLLLLENGADPELESYYDMTTPLDAAIKYKNRAVIERLLDLHVKCSFIQRLKMAFIRA